MSSRSHLVQVNRSMIILDKNGMPVNLGNTLREDYPESLFPALAYDGNNVLPTALGYRSHFGNSNLFNIGSALVDKLVQEILVFQSVNMSNIFIALCEDGLYIANATTGGGSFNWTRIVDLSADQTIGVRRQWTYCVLGNKPFFYLQGTAKFYGFVDLADYEETTIPTGIKPGASITQVWKEDALGVGILGYVPNFINMEGQIGLFKAGNRLGFWDSEGAVAWSSATQVYDFTPSTTTFAGVTTFTDVVGNIVLIKQHGSGFIIYATKSITLCSSMSGSPEKFSGSAIFSDVGVLFDIQIAVGQPDSIHYAITSGGLCVITSGSPKFVETEVMDYVRANNVIYALTFVDSRYLFIHTADDVNIPVPTYTVVDATGVPYTFPPVTASLEDDGQDILDLIEAMLNSQLKELQEEFSEVQEPTDPVAIEEKPFDKKLVPCWSGKKFDTNLDATVANSPVYQGYIEVPSQVYPGHMWHLPIAYRRPVYTNYYYETDDQFFDKAGDEYIAIFQDSMTRINEAAQIIVNADNLFLQTDLLEIDTDAPGYRVNLPNAQNIAVGAHETSFAEDLELGGWTWNNLIGGFSVTGKPSVCSLEFFPSKYDLKYTYSTTQIKEYVEFYPWLPSELRYIWAKSTLNGVESWSSLTGYTICVNIQTFRYGILPKDSEAAAVLSAVYLADFTAGEITDVGPTSGDKFPPFRPINYAGGVAVGSYLEDGRIAAMCYALGLTPSNLIEIKSFADPAYCARDETQNSNPAALTAASLPIVAWTNAGVAVTTKFYNYSVEEVLGGMPYCPPPSMGFVSEQVVTTKNFSTAGAYAHNLAITPDLGTDHYSPAEILATTLAITESQKYLPKVVRPYFGLVDQIKTQSVPDLSDYDDPTSLPAVFTSEVSGYGYLPTSGFSFRKTHSRSITKPCGYAGSESYTTTPDASAGKTFSFSANLGNTDLTPLKPPYQWDYPETIPLPPNYILFQQGSLSPYYQTFKEALVLDTQLTKWGRYNTPHRLVYSIFPINRVDQTIVPIQDFGLRAGALGVDGSCCLFTEDNPSSTITYGKIGDTRQGMTRATKFVAQFANTPNAYLIAEVSLNGESIDPSLSLAITADGSKFTQMPFTATGKWFNIRLEGSFNLVSLAIESEARGRR